MYFPGFLAFVDVTEQPIPRPENRLRRKIYYSGKKKKHTVKNIYTANQMGLIFYKSKRKTARKEYYFNIYKKNHLDVPQDVEIYIFNLGFLGLNRTFLKAITHSLSKRKWAGTLSTGKRLQQGPF